MQTMQTYSTLKLKISTWGTRQPDIVLHKCLYMFLKKIDFS